MKKQKGFSIGEVLVAMFLLLVGMVDAVALTARSVKDVINNRETIVATHLAQEGTELVRNVRDNTVTEIDNDGKYFTSFDTKYGFPDKTDSSLSICSIDYRGTLKCSSPNDVLYLDSSSGLYGHNQTGVSVATKYKRRVYITYEHTKIPDTEKKHMVANVTSVVVYGKDPLPETSNDIDDIEKKCNSSKKCAYAQTRLTSWINQKD